MGRRILLHVGLPKTGSTTLQRRLFAADHDVATFWRFSESTEGQRVAKLIWLRDSLAYDQKEVDDLVDAVAERRPDAAFVFTDEGVTDAGGGDRGLAARRLHATFPDATVLIVVREQVDYLLSYYVHRLRGYGLHHLDDRPPGEWFRHDARERMGERLTMLDYRALVGRYEELFGRERVAVRLFEDLRADTDGFLADVAGLYGGAVPDAEVETSHANARQTRRRVTYQRALRMLPLLKSVEVRLPPTAGDRFDAYLEGGDRVDVELDDEVRTWLRDRYRDGNRWLAEAHGLDLAGHGYAT